MTRGIEGSGAAMHYEVGDPPSPPLVRGERACGRAVALERRVRRSGRPPLAPPS